MVLQSGALAAAPAHGPRGGLPTLCPESRLLVPVPTAQGHFGETGTKVYAAAFERSAADAPSPMQHYPMAWDLANHGVAGVDRSAYYTATCSAC